MRRRLFIGGSAASVPLATAPALAAPSIASVKNTGVLRFIPQGDLNALDPTFAGSPNVRTHGYMVFDTLYGMDCQFRPVPQMVEGASVSDDGRDWQLTLRRGLVFHDGERVLARDCVASIRRFCTRDPFGQALADAIHEVGATDDRTIRFRLKRPFPLLPHALSTTPQFMPAMMPERLATTDPARPIGEIIGSGPFRFEAAEQIAGARYAYSRFEGYQPRDDGALGWTGGPKVVRLDRVEWTVMTDPSIAYAALLAGEMDWWEYADLNLIDAIRAAPGLVLETTDTTGMKADLRMNQAIPPFDNPDTRRALLGAIDQADVCVAMAGTDPAGWREPVGFFAPESPMASDVGMAAFTTPRDVAGAAAKLKAAGYARETVVTLSAANIPTSKAATLLVADLFRRLGMTVDYQEMDWGTLSARRMRRTAEGGRGWNTWIVPGPGLGAFDPVSSTLLRTGPQAFYGWPQGDRLERLRAEWLQAPDLSAQQAVAREIQAQAFIDLPVIPLGLYFQPTAYRRAVRGVLPGFATFWNVWKQ